jgi:hypothetical protein
MNAEREAPMSEREGRDRSALSAEREAQ